jgi:hypothetical protein
VATFIWVNQGSGVLACFLEGHVSLRPRQSSGSPFVPAGTVHRLCHTGVVYRGVESRRECFPFRSPGGSAKGSQKKKNGRPTSNCGLMNGECEIRSRQNLLGRQQTAEQGRRVARQLATEPTWEFRAWGRAQSLCDASKRDTFGSVAVGMFGCCGWCAVHQPIGLGARQRSHDRIWRCPPGAGRSPLQGS